MFSESLDDGPVFSTSVSVLKYIGARLIKVSQFGFKYQDFIIYSATAGFVQTLIYSVGIFKV